MNNLEEGITFANYKLTKTSSFGELDFASLFCRKVSIANFLLVRVRDVY